MCIFEPEAEAPNCCCDEECAELGDCCGDFGTCCTGGGAKLGVRVDARHGTRRRVARRDSVPYRDIGRDFGGVDQTDLENLEEQMDLNGFGQPSRGFIRPVRAASGARARATSSGRDSIPTCCAIILMDSGWTRSFSTATCPVGVVSAMPRVRTTRDTNSRATRRDSGDRVGDAR